MDHIQPAPSDEALAAQLEISFDGRRYAYRQYRYDHFDDAVNYARANRNRANFAPDDSFVPNWNAPFGPTDEDMQLMKPYGIIYSGGCFVYGNYRYDQLENAVAYASNHMAW